MILTPARRRQKRRIQNLPTAHDCKIWVRRPKTIGKLACVVCGKN